MYKELSEHSNLIALIICLYQLYLVSLLRVNLPHYTANSQESRDPSVLSPYVPLISSTMSGAKPVESEKELEK